MPVKRSITHPSQYHVVSDPDGKLKLFAPQSKKMLDKEILWTGVYVGDASANVEPFFYDYHPSDILVTLSAKPKIGKVYGCKIAPYRGSHIVGRVGIVDHFVLLSEEEIKRIHGAMSRVTNLMQSHKMLPPGPTTFHVRELEGRHNGYYKYGEEQDTITHCVTPGSINPVAVAWVHIHEHGHGIWVRLMSEEIKSRWLIAFEKRKTGWKCTSAEAMKLKAEFLASGLDFETYAENIDEDEANILWALHAAIMAANPFRAKDIQLMCNVGKIEPYLKPLKFADIQQYLEVNTEDVTKYAAKNVEEFWCESLSKAVLGLSLTQFVQKMVIATLKSYGATFASLKTSANSVPESMVL